MSRPLGGYIGHRPAPATAGINSAAGGMWTLPEAQRLQQAGTWPLSTAPIGDPNDIPGLSLWLDGSAAATMFDAADAPLLGVEGDVARWEDRSGNGRHFTQSSSSLRPARRLAVKNGLSAVAFANDFLVGTHTYTIGTVFCLWNHPTTATGDAFAGIISQRTALSVRTPNGSISFVLSVQNLDVSKVCLFPGNSPPPATHRLNGGTAEAGYVNFNVGQAVRTTPDRWQYASTVLATPVTGVQAFALGADNTVSSGRLIQNGHIGEVIAYSGSLTAAQVASVDAYLIAKWGLA